MSTVPRAVAGPVIAALVVIGLLAAWVTTGGAGTLTRVRLQVSLAAVPMRAFTAQAAAADRQRDHVPHHPQPDRNRRPAHRGPQPAGPAGRADRAAARPGPGTAVPSLTIPAHGTLELSPFGDDLVLQDPQPFETLAAVPLILTFRHAGTVTIQASVTAPGTP